ncbi:hypothetical protein M0R89_19605 (plasmid) [Halorussus limi]|uniref:Lipoprotein n=1 Tax=Halorussus limi TaxID=2938695 RepID=A0A8U0HZK4_9EURY|nr:hypothetical protein [Halorussus limi]UPV76368.1 hypothetical protein M0R89_19605 [Halorussus limi]
MPALPRRRLLQGAVALATGLAGCSDLTTETESVPGDRPPEHVARDPDRVRLRTSGRPRSPVWLPRDDALRSTGDADSTDESATSAPDAARRTGLVATRATADRLEFADVDGADAARAFVADTDFGRATLYFDTRRLGACYTAELCSVAWSDTEIEVEYGYDYRDADVPCQTDDSDAVAWLIRVPVALEPDAVTNRGSSSSDDGCDYPEYLRIANANSAGTTATGNETTPTATRRTPTRRTPAREETATVERQTEISKTTTGKLQRYTDRSTTEERR